MFGFGSSTKSDGKMKRRKELDLKGVKGHLLFLHFNRKIQYPIFMFDTILCIPIIISIVNKSIMCRER